MRIKRVIAATAGALAIIGAGVITAPAPASASASVGVYLGGVDMQAACNNQYPEQGRVAEVYDRRSAFSWICAVPIWGGPVGGISVNQQCATQYGNGAYAGLRDRRDPFSWYCQR